MRKNNENHKQSGKCSPCVSRLYNLCCDQVKQTDLFKSYRRNQVFKFLYDLGCKISYIYSNVEYVNFNTKQTELCMTYYPEEVFRRNASVVQSVLLANTHFPLYTIYYVSIVCNICFNRFKNFSCVPIYIFGFCHKQCASD